MRARTHTCLCATAAHRYATVVKALLLMGADPTGTGGYEDVVVEVDPPPISQMTAEEARKRR